MVYIPRSRDRICVDLHLHRASRYPEPAQLHLMTLITGQFFWFLLFAWIGRMSTRKGCSFGVNCFCYFTICFFGMGWGLDGTYIGHSLDWVMDCVHTDCG